MTCIDRVRLKRQLVKILQVIIPSLLSDVSSILTISGFHSKAKNESPKIQFFFKILKFAKNFRNFFELVHKRRNLSAGKTLPLCQKWKEGDYGGHPWSRRRGNLGALVFSSRHSFRRSHLDPTLVAKMLDFGEWRNSTKAPEFFAQLNLQGIDPQMAILSFMCRLLLTYWFLLKQLRRTQAYTGVWSGPPIRNYRCHQFLKYSMLK